MIQRAFGFAFELAFAFTGIVSGVVILLHRGHTVSVVQTLPEAQVTWYALSLSVGGVLIVVGLLGSLLRPALHALEEPGLYLSGSAWLVYIVLLLTLPAVPLIAFFFAVPFLLACIVRLFILRRDAP